MDVNSLPKTVTRQRRDCDLNPGPSAPESSMLTTRLPSHPFRYRGGYSVVHIPLGLSVHVTVDLLTYWLSIEEKKLNRHICELQLNFK